MRAVKNPGTISLENCRNFGRQRLIYSLFKLKWVDGSTTAKAMNSIMVDHDNVLKKTAAC